MYIHEYGKHRRQMIQLFRTKILMAEGGSRAPVYFLPLGSRSPNAPLHQVRFLYFVWTEYSATASKVASMQNMECADLMDCCGEVQKVRMFAMNYGRYIGS